ncbi:hypothetical protein PRUPE_2G101200 [Prunus persica]|uniref:Uncharacterized protein n=1 Tax=Prunus persica TaxID=3760 RepID=M5XEC6_PRUPE|nr:hypothetical protein PRUPE_2G101200 [Prunus persica]
MNFSTEPCKPKPSRLMGRTQTPKLKQPTSLFVSKRRTQFRKFYTNTIQVLFNSIDCNKMKYNFLVFILT